MKLSASTPEERKRQLILLGLLAVAIAFVVYRQMGGVSADGALAPMPAPASTATPAAPGRAGLPEPVRLAALEPVPTQVSGARNPFGFGARTPPPAPPRPSTPPPAAPPPPPPAPAGPPPRPPVPVKFLGFAEVPSHPGKVVSLRVGESVVLAREGDLVDGRYRLLKIGLESIVMAYADGQGQTTIRLSGQ